MALPYLNRISTQLQSKFELGVRNMALRLGVMPEWIVLAMYRESSLNPQAVNSSSGATGLIQFMPKTATGLGTSTAAIKKMNAVQQLPLVEKYLSNQIASTRIHPTRLVDMYLLILYPKAVGKPNNYILFKRGTTAYRQNSSINPTGDVTVADVEKFINHIVPAEWQTAVVSSVGIGALVAGAVAAWVTITQFKLKKRA